MIFLPNHKLNRPKIILLCSVVMVLIISGLSVWLINNKTIHSDSFKDILPGITRSENILTPVKPLEPEVTGGVAPEVSGGQTETETERVFSETPPEINKGDVSKKQVIFTFDGGSGSQSAQTVLDVLSKYKITGTFFLTGTWASQNETLTKAIAQNGHEIYNHTYTHPHLTQISDQEIIKEFQDTNSLIQNLTGVSTKPYFRSPYGERNAHILEVVAKEGYQSVYWTTDALDWKESEGTSADEVRQRILDNLKPGTIYLMHLGDNITGQILDDIFQTIQDEGYQIVSLSQGI